MKWGFPGLLYYLWLLLPAAWLVYRLTNRRVARLHQLVDAGRMTDLAPAFLLRRLRTRNHLWFLAVLFLLLALARPQWGFQWMEVKRRGLDLMVVLDTSRSMMAEDIKPNRLQQAKWGIRDLVQKLRGDRIGLVAFAGGSFLQCPLTIDYAAFLMTLDDIYAGIIPKGGTDIEQALRTAIGYFDKSTEADRVVILVTDGEFHEGDPTRLLEDLKRERVRVYTIGIGSRDGELIPVTDEQGRSTFLKDREGNVVKTSLHEDVLEKLALGTGGTYVRSTASDTGLEQVFEKGLADLNRAESDSKMVRSYEERFYGFLGLALLCLALEASVSTTRRRKAA